MYPCGRWRHASPGRARERSDGLRQPQRPERRCRGGASDDRHGNAAYNVRFNLPGIKGGSFAETCRARMASALSEVDRLARGAEEAEEEAL